jgi:hypothetical protein
MRFEMPNRRIIILCFLLISIQIFSQGDKSYFTKINIDDKIDLNVLEEYELLVFHITNNYLFTAISENEISKLIDLGFQLETLDEIEAYDKYFLISSKGKFDTGNPYLSNKIYSGDSFVIIKNIVNMSERLLRENLLMVELKPATTFKNIKTLLPESPPAINDTLIINLVSAVNADSIQYFIQSLQDFQTRFLFASTRDSVASWIKHQFLRMGYTDVVIDSFYYDGTWQKNVIATLTGSDEPQKINIIGGHHDSYSSGDPLIFAPGADDNASGTSAVLEIARVIKERNYNPESTIKFITFGAEEYGLWGSKDFALKAYNSGMEIKIMINHDMISHTYNSVGNSEVDINYYSGFEYLRELAADCTEQYSIITPHTGSLNSSGSDSHSFWQLGFPSVYFEETNFSPYYHSPNDIITNYNMEYCAEVIKSSCATLLSSMLLPSPVNNYYLMDIGTGSSLLSSWTPNTEPDLVGYKIYVGTSSGIYEDTYTTSDSTYVVEGLTEGTMYYIGVSAYDSDGYESIIRERSGTPRLLPLAPEGFSVSPAWHSVELIWNENSEFDLLGYNLYRSLTSGSTGDKLNIDVLTDTMFVDNTAAGGIYYFYTVKAVDSLLNESINNTTLKTRAITLDQGILVIDETTDGDGSLMNPTDEQVDDFYSGLLSNFKSDEYDLIDEENLNLAVIGAYSSVIWHGNDTENLNAPFVHKQILKQYLDFGGNILFTVYRPSKAFEQIFGFQGSYGPGDFIYDYLKIDESLGSLNALFNGAIGIEPDYSNIFIDSVKTLVSNQYHLKTIENIEPSGSGTAIFKYESMFDSTSTQGSLKGKPVGVEYIGTDYKVVTLSFPLYYMNFSEAKELTEYIMFDKFEEVMPVEKEENILPSEYSLSQNYPNPFNPTTTIKYDIREISFVTLKVYDILGKEVSILVKEEKPIGTHTIEFDATGLPSGIYFYRLEAGDINITKKMTLLK